MMATNERLSILYFPSAVRNIVSRLVSPDRVVAPGGERMAAQKPYKRLYGTPEGSVSFQRLFGIMRAGRCISADWPTIRRNGYPVYPDGRNGRLCQNFSYHPPFDISPALFKELSTSSVSCPSVVSDGSNEAMNTIQRFFSVMRPAMLLYASLINLFALFR